MSKKKPDLNIESSRLHPRNKHRDGYDFDQLVRSYPLLAKHLHINDYQNTSINFFDPAAVKALNTALLLTHYSVDYWDIPAGYLCPAVPGRADYIHHLADLIQSNQGKNPVPQMPQINCLDIGTGANCIYPIIGRQEYGWSFVGSDINPEALQSANQIIANNKTLRGNIELRLQEHDGQIFTGIVRDSEYFDFCLCNPPFHASAAEASIAAKRKLKHLGHRSDKKPVLNFGGNHKELWCNGGEVGFISQMIDESSLFATSCFWFSTLVSKQESIDVVLSKLAAKNPTRIHQINMSTGHKKSRILAWTFLSEKQQKIWAATRWS